MWTEGTMNINGKTFEYQIKHFAEGSDWGIDCGRISKLWIKDTATEKVAVNYDRGWDVKPETKAAQKAAEKLIKKYN